MPLPVPVTDNRSFQSLVDDMVARIPAHTPEWTNFGPSDPGITLIQLFAHITESLIYRANQIPERNRQKFLRLLGVPMQAARDAKGIVSFANERAGAERQVIARNSELFAGAIPFRTTTALDVLPLTARLFLRRAVTPPQEQIDYYRLLYASYDKPEPMDFAFYEAVDVTDAARIDLSAAVDQTLWIGLFADVRHRDAAGGVGGDAAGDPWATLKAAIQNRTLSLGIVPDLIGAARTLSPGVAPSLSDGLLRFEMPNIGQDVDFSSGAPVAGYTRLPVRAGHDPLTAPGIVELTLPSADRIGTWTALDPLEAGVGNLPPALDPPELADSLVTWVRMSAGTATNVALRWVGINAALVSQQLRVANERLEDGTGMPDQERVLRHAPVLAGSVEIGGILPDARIDYREVDDVRAAAPEVPADGSGAATAGGPLDVFSLDAEQALVRFGDGFAGRRPRIGEALYASYATTAGAQGNVPAAAIKAGPAITAGISATNPLPSWGGADPESSDAAERQVPRFITHRDRLVTAEDFAAIAWRTPGVSLGRVEVLPAAHPRIAPVTPGTAPGAVTLMVVPLDDPAHPGAPRATPALLDALCGWLEPRRLITTELVIDGPAYVGIWISIGIEIAGGYRIAEVVDAVTRRIRAFLSPLPPEGTPLPLLPSVYGDPGAATARGWPLGQAVHVRSMMAEVARAAGVISVEGLEIAKGGGGAFDTIPMAGLELPEILGISVVAGPPVPLDHIRGNAVAGSVETVAPRLPVPVLAETC